jgi:hypothetical protein
MKQIIYIKVLNNNTYLTYNTKTQTQKLELLWE